MMFAKLFIVIFAALCANVIVEVESAKILGIFPMPAPSHYFLGDALMRALVKKGHEVTLISAFKQKKPIKNYKDVVIEGFYEEIEGLKKDMLQNTGASPITQAVNMSILMQHLAERPLQDPAVQAFINSNEKFDLVIMEAFLNEAQLGIAHRFNTPVVILSTIGSNDWVNSYTKTPAPISYCPQIMSKFNGKMNFWERVQNTILTIVSSGLFNFHHLPNQNTLLKKYFPDAPDLYELMRERTSLVLLNSHSSLADAKPLVPNTIEIGGYHIDDPKPLPKDLKDYLDNAKEGFILFSLGSNIKSTMLPLEKRETILKVFGNLPYKILWKFEDENLPGKPANVKISKWLPQNDILAHPNLKLFITHGGLLSTIEATYHGIPVVGIPILGDQKANMATAERQGFGIGIDFTTMDYDVLFNAVNKVLKDKSYSENMKRRSAIMRDRPMKPIDTATYWIEYALRHKSADHLKTGAMYLKWYEEYLLDVIAFLGTIIFVVMYIFYAIVKKLWNCCCKSNKKSSSIKSATKNKKNN